MNKRLFAGALALILCLSMIHPAVISAMAAEPAGSSALEQELKEHQISDEKALSPTGTMINLFDYWIDESNDPERPWAAPDHIGLPENTADVDKRANQGINAGHYLKFGKLTGSFTSPAQASTHGAEMPMFFRVFWKIGWVQTATPC